MYMDGETIPNYEIPESLWPTAKYGNTKDPEKRKKIDETWAGDGQIKAMSTDTRLCKPVSLQYMVGGEFVSGNENDETKMIKEWWYAVKSVNQIVGHNIFYFDLPLIVNRSMLLGIDPSVQLKFRKYDTKPIFDTMQVFTQWVGTKEMLVSLDWLLEWFGLPMKTGDGSQVWGWYVEKNFDKIHEYGRDDVKSLPAIHSKLSKYYK